MKHYSFWGEDIYVLERIPSGVFADFGAGDGSSWSNTLLLAEHGWTGLCVDYDKDKFAFLSELHQGRGIALRNDKVAAENACELLESAGIPTAFDFLSVDIDGMDAWVIDAVLSSYKPRIVICEFNHLVPPPIRFCMNYDPDFSWGRDHLFGASVQHMTDVIEKRGYGLDRLFLNNAAFVLGSTPKVLSTALWESQVVPAAKENAGQHSIPYAWPTNVETYINILDDLFGHTGEYALSLDPL